MALQLSERILDKFIAPEFSKLTSCDVPELPALPNYLGSWVVHSALVGPPPDRTIPLTIIFLRRLALAAREYTSGREHVLQCVAALPHSSEAVTSYLRALSHFEQCVVAAALALSARHSIGKMYDPPNYKKFELPIGSSEQRLWALYKSIKHFNEWIEEKQDAPADVPVWLTPQGLRSRKKKSEEFVDLRFSELVELLTELKPDAKWLSEDVFRTALERKRQREAEEGSGAT